LFVLFEVVPYFHFQFVLLFIYSFDPSLLDYDKSIGAVVKMDGFLHDLTYLSLYAFMLCHHIFSLQGWHRT
jgi:hypothetical protein